MRTFISECILRATVATTGYCGEESVCGSHTKIVFDDLSHTYVDSSFSGEIIEDKALLGDKRIQKRIVIELVGDAEISAMIKALRFSAEALEALVKGSDENPMCD
jgi:hypothetical protein